MAETPYMGLYLPNRLDRVPIDETLANNFSMIDSKFSDFFNRFYKVNVMDYGAKGDGTTDDTQAFTDAKNYIMANGGTLYIPPNMNCYLPNGFDLFGIRNIQVDGTITGVTGKELVCGIRSGITLVFKAYFNRLVNITLKIQGVKNGDIIVNSAPHLLLWADSANPDIDSTAYSRYLLGKVDHVEINSAGSMAWINENKFFGGRLTKLTIGGAYTHNHNIFYGPTLENSTININRGSSTHVLDVRFEGNNTVTFGADSWDNLVVRSWHNAPGSFLRSEARTSYADNGKGNQVVNMADAYHDYYKIFELNNSTENYNANHIVKNGKQLEVVSAGLYKNILETDFIPLEDDIGVDIRSDGAFWRGYVELYDSNKTKLAAEPTGAFSSGVMTWNTTNNQYSSTVNRNFVNFAIFKGTNAKYAKIRVQPHVTGLFSYLNVAVRHSVSINIQFPILPVYSKRTINTIPTAGTWDVGDKVEYVTPTASGYIGAVCTVAGTPGTWKRFGAIEA